MGCSPFTSWSEDYSIPNVNPDPYNFQILKYKQYENAWCLRVRYPDCTNFEGIKILVLRSKDLYLVMDRKMLDPHFEEGTDLVARFNPNEWKLAKKFAKSL